MAIVYVKSRAISVSSWVADSPVWDAASFTSGRLVGVLSGPLRAVGRKETRTAAGDPDEGAVAGRVVRIRRGHNKEAAVKACWSDATTTSLLFYSIFCPTITICALWRAGKGATSNCPPVSSVLYKRIENTTGSGGTSVVTTSGHGLCACVRS